MVYPKGSILLTGGTGSLGQAILRRAKHERWDCRFTVYSRDEVKQWEVKQQYPDNHYALGDVRDADRLLSVASGHDLIIHAAAMKQIPASEVDTPEAVATNVTGSLNVISVAARLGVPQVLGISTDKACQPVNAYGMTKAIMEKMFQAASRHWPKTRFSLVRYGNVINTRGSVVPAFRRQIEEKGYLEITDERMTRFWLTVDQAVDIILEALSEERSGIVTIPKAPAATILALAEAMAPDVPRRVVGVRPGEKLHEHLLHGLESHLAKEDREYFKLFPTFKGPDFGLPPNREYRSDLAPQLTIDQLREMVAVSYA